MSILHKYIKPIFLYLIVSLLGFLVMLVPSYLLPFFYDILVDIFPDVFPVFSKTGEPEMYREYMKWVTTIAVSITLIVVNYISLRLDNKRFEEMIDITDGLYPMSVGMGVYLKNNVASDIVTSVIVPPMYLIPAVFIPEEIFKRWLTLPLWCYNELNQFFDIVTMVIIVTAVSLVARLLVIYPTVKVWRAMWLTASVE